MRRPLALAADTEPAVEEEVALRVLVDLAVTLVDVLVFELPFVVDAVDDSVSPPPPEAVDVAPVVVGQELSAICRTPAGLVADGFAPECCWSRQASDFPFDPTVPEAIGSAATATLPVEASASAATASPAAAAFRGVMRFMLSSLWISCHCRTPKSAVMTVTGRPP
jgi:hypothetical protein